MLVPFLRGLMSSLVYCQVALPIGGIIAGPAAETLVPLSRGQVDSLVYFQVTLVIGGIIAGPTAKRLVSLLRGLVGFWVLGQVALDITTLFEVPVILIIFTGDDYERLCVCRSQLLTPCRLNLNLSTGVTGAGGDHPTFLKPCIIFTHPGI